VKRLAKVLVCLMVGLLTARAAAAAPVTVNYSFEVDKVEDYKDYMLGGNVKKGDVLHGTIVFDSDAADESPEAEWGFYSFVNPYAFTLSLPTSIVSNEFYVQVHDGAGDLLEINGLPVAPVELRQTGPHQSGHGAARESRRAVLDADGIGRRHQTHPERPSRVVHHGRTGPAASVRARADVDAAARHGPRWRRAPAPEAQRHEGVSHSASAAAR
jgi:hypothetical protein